MSTHGVLVYGSNSNSHVTVSKRRAMSAAEDGESLLPEMTTLPYEYDVISTSLPDTHRTGPKGVLADYSHYQHIQQERLRDHLLPLDSSLWTPASTQLPSQHNIHLDQKVYGVFTEITQDEYVNVIDETASSSTPILVHIYEPVLLFLSLSLSYIPYYA